jgi:hypothetical protein
MVIVECITHRSWKVWRMFFPESLNDINKVTNEQEKHLKLALEFQIRWTKTPGFLRAWSILKLFMYFYVKYQFFMYNW